MKEDDEVVSPIVQLAYVLPLSSMDFIPEKYREAVVKYKKKTNDISMDWSFCKYFWECHIDFPMENINELKYIIDNVKKDKDNVKKDKDNIIFTIMENNEVEL